MHLFQYHGHEKRIFLLVLIVIAVQAGTQPLGIYAGETQDTLLLEQCARKSTPAIFKEVLSGMDHPSAHSLGMALLAAFDGSHADAIVPILIAAGANPAFGEDINSGVLSKSVVHRIERKTPGSLATVRLLLEHGVHPDSIDEIGYTPLMKAASANDLELAELLTAFHANPLFSNKDGRMALDMAGDPSMRKLLQAAVDQRPNPWGDPSIAALKLLEPTGADRGKTFEPSVSRDIAQWNRQALQQALVANDIQDLKDILKNRQGVHPDVDLGEGLRPLMMVQSAEAARVLVNHGANPNLRDVKGCSPLHYAVMTPRSGEIISVLLDAGADVNAINNDMDTPLSMLRVVFIEFKDFATMQTVLNQLVQAGADINCRDKFGDTLLHVAANNDNAALAEAVLALGADRALVNHSGDTPYDIASRLNSSSVLKLLKKK